jgi:hypothetical protein
MIQKNGKNLLKPSIVAKRRQNCNGTVFNFFAFFPAFEIIKIKWLLGRLDRSIDGSSSDGSSSSPWWNLGLLIKVSGLETTPFIQKAIETPKISFDELQCFVTISMVARALLYTLFFSRADICLLSNTATILVACTRVSISTPKSIHWRILACV